MQRKTASRFISGTQMNEVIARRLALSMALMCVRNTCIEDIHAGVEPSSKAGDFSDAKLVTPYGEIPWNNLSRIRNDEMRDFMKQVVDRLYTVLAGPTRRSDHCRHHAGDPLAAALGARLFRRCGAQEARPRSSLGEGRWRPRLSHRPRWRRFPPTWSRGLSAMPRVVIELGGESGP